MEPHCEWNPKREASGNVAGQQCSAVTPTIEEPHSVDGASAMSGRRLVEKKRSMTKEQLKNRVANIIALSGDPEAAHSEEDALYREIIKELCPSWVVREINKLSKADFPRWCA